MNEKREEERGRERKERKWIIYGECVCVRLEEK